MIWLFVLIFGAASFLWAVWYAVGVNEKRFHDIEYENRTTFNQISGRQNSCDEKLRVTELENKKLKAEQEKAMAYSYEESDRVNSLVDELKKVSKELEFIRAHAHGMDKRIAGLKREVIVTINEPPTKPSAKQKVTKSLLKRAGVTQ